MNLALLRLWVSLQFTGLAMKRLLQMPFSLPGHTQQKAGSSAGQDAFGKPLRALAAPLL